MCIATKFNDIIKSIYVTCNFLECVLTTVLSVYITDSVISCVVSESNCLTVTISCEADFSEEVEWLNPDHYVINSTDEDRIHSKKF